ncbi:MAG: glycosyl hydrolase family 28-related protein, partial [Candidatus Aquicultor sp.]
MTGPIVGFEDKGGQVFNVKAYGAKGDGVTDDAAAINAAITAATAVGGIVFLPPGTYYITSAILNVNAPCNIVGANRESTIIMVNNGLGGIGINGTGHGSGTADHCTVSDLTIDTATHAVNGACIAIQANYTTLRNLIIKGSGLIFAI